MIDCGCDEILLPQGSNGVDGKNAFTVTTAQFVQPGIGNSITINVSDSLQNTNQWAIAGQIIKITDSVGNGGWYQVTGITGTTQITATQLDYPGTSGSNILVGAGVSPAGLQGPQGDPGTPGAVGDTGPPNSLRIPLGGVTTLPPGSDATASIIGDAPNQSLLLGIPRGNPGYNGSGLLGSAPVSSSQIYSGTGLTQSMDTFLAGLDVTFNTIDAFPTEGSTVRSTMFLKARFTSTNTLLQTLSSSAEVYYLPRIVKITPIATTIYDLDVALVDKDPLISSSRKLLPPSAVSGHPTHGTDIDQADESAWARAELPKKAINGVFPFAYTKIVTTIVRRTLTRISIMVEYTTTSRFGTYTAIYQPEVDFSISISPTDSTEQLKIALVGNITVPSGPTSATVTHVFHTVEKSIL